MQKKHQNTIPKIFHSDFTEKPIDRCIRCEKNVIETGEMYLIEKAIKSYPNSTAFSTIFEYAICLSCYQQMHSEMSKDSKAAIEEFVQSNLNKNQRMAMAAERVMPDDPEWINQCAITGLNKKDLTEYQVCAYCTGNELVTSQPPLLISGQATDAMAELLSAETIDFLDDFKQHITGGPPELAELLQDRKLLLI